MAALYKKRAGTSGISGQLYETKLISLIVFRLLHHDQVEHFHLASNMDEVGAFDDVCLKVKFQGLERPVVLFLQVKHKDNDDKFLSLDNKNDLVKWSDSILKIKKKMTSNRSNDKLFSGDDGDAEYVFILYTNAKCDFDSNHQFVSNYAADVNRLLSTSETVATRPTYTEKDVEEFGEKILKEDFTLLADRLTKFFTDKSNQSMNIMNDEYILRYHVILQNKVVNVSPIQTEEQKPDSKWRLLTFKHDFFTNEDAYVALFRSVLYEQLLKNQRKVRKNSEVEERAAYHSPTPEAAAELISSFLSDPSAATLSPVIDAHITCNKNGKLEFISEKSQSDTKRLGQINISRAVVEEARIMAAKNILLSTKLKVPTAFGNLDLAISGNEKKVERRLNHLRDTIVDLCEKFTQKESYKLVTIDDTVDSGVLSPNGGLAAAVGNILTYDEDTRLLKFTDDSALLQSNSQTLFVKLKNKINDLHEYRFDVRTIKFPKLSLDCTNISREFLSKLVIYAKQSNHYEVEDILKHEIESNQKANAYNFSMKSDSIFLYYHNEIQKWWMSPKLGSYLTKENNMYEQAINNVVIEPQLSALQNTFYMNNIKYFGYTFTEDALESFSSLEGFANIIATDITALTTVKVIQHLTNNTSNSNYTVLDLECVLNLRTLDFCALDTELRKTEKIIIIVCDSLENNNLQIRLSELADAAEKKQVIIVTNTSFIELVQAHFPHAKNIINDTHSLSSMISESQNAIIGNAKVIFQGKEMSLGLLVDDDSVAFIKGAVLNKLIRNGTITLGKSLSNANYEEIKDFYVDRRISEAPRDLAPGYTNDVMDPDAVRIVRTFHDIEDDAVLVTAAPGMGKSTLLTHLSLKTSECETNVWIVRINLLDHSKTFHKWQQNKTAIDTLHTLQFMCQAILRNDGEVSVHLNEVNNKVYLKSCAASEWAVFELNMFLHFYNEGKLIFLFDGFDEICPHYKDNVINFLNVVRTYPRRNKMWVTSRPYSEILPDLQRVLGKYFKLEHLCDTEQVTYLHKAWSVKLVFDELNDEQITNVTKFIKLMPRLMTTSYTYDALHFRFRRIYFTFYDYVLSHFPHIISRYDFLHIKKRFKTNPDDDEPQSDNELTHNADTHASTEVDTLLGTPLLLYFIADYLVNVIDIRQNINMVHFDLNVLSIYKMFIDSKLKKILYQDKNKMDIYNPDIMTRYEKEHAECIKMHKRIAAYILLGSPIFSGLNLEEFKNMDPLNEDIKQYNVMINAIKSGAEKTGLISHVTGDNVPVFIHRTFAEYFAAEFICDIFKSENFEFGNKKLLYTTTYICHKNDVYPWISKKREIDKELDHILKDIELLQPIFLTWYRNIFNSANWPLEQYIRIMNSSQDDWAKSFEKNNEYIQSINKVVPASSLDAHCERLQHIIVKRMRPHLRKYFSSFAEPNRIQWFRRAISYNK